ncbi:MAG: acyl-CoA dehydrogenase family protein [Deltaproteobacteria bacterium]|nr:acyl-CoA dehydrogenase family protein [Deltaproteobacteria bacterium]
MEIRFSEKEQAFYDEVDEFLQKELPSDWHEKPIVWPGDYSPSGYGSEENYRIALEFRAKVIEKGWLTISWPKEYGGKEYTNMEQAIFDERMSYYRVMAADVLAAGIVAPMLLRIGTKEQQKKWVPRIAAGEITMWLAYSEPNAGSDLGAIETTALEDGDDYVINGQKVWSSGAHLTDYGWMIAKTDPNARKHRGVSLFIVDNKTPGVTMRPIYNILGEHSFNEVFFDDVRVPKENLIGEKNAGFYHLMTALDYERVTLVGVGGFRRIFEELTEYVKTGKRNGEPLCKIPSVRSELARLSTKIEILYMLFWRTAEMADRKLDPTVESSVLKVVSTELAQEIADVAMDILGPYGHLTEKTEWTPLRALVSRGFLDAISATIGAGTSEIQRNIIAQRGLGLPRVKQGGKKS